MKISKDKLLREIAAGASLAHMAGLFDCLQRDVREYASAHDIEIPASVLSAGGRNKIDPVKLRSMVREGYNADQIADHFSCKKSSVWNQCRRLSLPLPSRHPKKPEPTNDAPADPVADPWLQGLIATGGRYADLVEWAKQNGLTTMRAQTEWHKLRRPIERKPK